MAESRSKCPPPIPSASAKSANQFIILQRSPLPAAMEGKNIECCACRRGFEEGANVLEVQEGIIGKLGFVALGERLLLCDFECLRNYLDDSKGHDPSPARASAGQVVSTRTIGMPKRLDHMMNLTLMGS